MKNEISERSITHTRPEPEGNPSEWREWYDGKKGETCDPTVHECQKNSVKLGRVVYNKDGSAQVNTEYTEEQEKLRKEAKAGKLGIKFDNGKDKLRWDLLPLREIEQVVKILTLGAEKYADNNWMYVPENKKRYFAAAMRHLVAWFKGEKLDKESNENHLAHAICCILFMLWKNNEDEIDK